MSRHSCPVISFIVRKKRNVTTSFCDRPFTSSFINSPSLCCSVFLIITPYFCWLLLLSLKLTNKGDMKWTTPFQCFCKQPAPEAAAASGDTLQTDDRNANIIETENEPAGWYYPTRFRKRGRCCRNITWYVVEYTVLSVNEYTPFEK